MVDYPHSDYDADSKKSSDQEEDVMKKLEAFNANLL